MNELQKKSLSCVDLDKALDYGVLAPIKVRGNQTWLEYRAQKSGWPWRR